LRASIDTLREELGTAGAIAQNLSRKLSSGSLDSLDKSRRVVSFARHVGEVDTTSVMLDQMWLSAKNVSSSSATAMALPSLNSEA